jgi:hypothetical protein
VPLAGAENLIYTLFSKLNNLSSREKIITLSYTLLPYYDDQNRQASHFSAKKKNDEKMKKIFKTSKICIACLFYFSGWGAIFAVSSVCLQAQHVGRNRPLPSPPPCRRYGMLIKKIVST